MPTLFSLTTITYWQAVGLFILAKILMGGCGGSRGGGKAHRRYKERFRERCEEKENRITSYNVCYTKLLRETPLWAIYFMPVYFLAYLN